MYKEKGIVVSDFDGTVTDNGKEASNYAFAYFEQMAEMTRIGELELMEMVYKAEEEIRSNPGIYGWSVDGLIVAPAVADPYVFTTATMQLIALQNNLSIPKEKWDDIHKKSYAQTGVSFKSEAREYLSALQSSGRLVVVTNSHTDQVMKKIEALMGENEIRVIGNARKHQIEDGWDVVPLTAQHQGFPRPVQLRRRQYGETLSLLGDVDWVVGDIYELDLALPEALGVGTVLVSAPHTPSYEVAHYEKHQKGFSSDNLLEVLARIF